MKTMQHRRLPHPWVVWLALCVMFFMALAPTVSHALAWAQTGSEARFEVCTSQGMLNISDGPADQESPPSLEHCPFCLHATHPFAPAPHHLAFLAVRMGSYGVPWVVRAPLYYGKHYPAWVSRAPPTSA